MRKYVMVTLSVVASVIASGCFKPIVKSEKEGVVIASNPQKAKEEVSDVSPEPVNQDYWLGKWSDETGYWIVIESVSDGYTIQRSGDEALMTFKKKQLDDRVFIYEEKGRFVHYVHTLTRISQNTISDEWFDMEAQTVWQVDKLTRE